MTPPLATIPIPGIPTLLEFAATEALASIVTNEVFSWWSRRNQRGDYYQLAAARAKLTGRPLIVIGDPDSHVTRGEVGYGDLCVDLTGCPLAPLGVKADITVPGSIRKRDGTPVADDSAVVVIFCVLEYVPDIDAAWREVMRVAGNFSNVFVVYVDPMCLTAYFYPGAKHVIRAAPPTAPTLEYSNVQVWTPKPIAKALTVTAPKPAAPAAPSKDGPPVVTTGAYFSVRARPKLFGSVPVAAWRRAA